MAVFVSRQKKYSVSFLPQLQDHAVHQPAGPANKQNIHLFSFLPQFLIRQLAPKRNCLRCLW